MKESYYECPLCFIDTQTHKGFSKGGASLLLLSFLSSYEITNKHKLIDKEKKKEEGCVTLSAVS